MSKTTPLSNKTYCLLEDIDLIQTINKLAELAKKHINTDKIKIHITTENEQIEFNNIDEFKEVYKDLQSEIYIIAFEFKNKLGKLIVSSINYKEGSIKIILLLNSKEQNQTVELEIKEIFLITELFHNDQQNYVNLSRIIELSKIKSGDYDLSRLINLCKELNVASKHKSCHSVIMLVRAILDHIPPIFGKNNFQEVTNNYGGKSFKASMLYLENSSRNIANSVLHVQIRKKEVLPNRTQVNFTNDLEVLLAEIVRILK